MSNKLDIAWYSIIANLFIFVINTVVSYCYFQKNKNNNNFNYLTSELLMCCDSCVRNACKYWSENLKKDERINCGNTLKSEIKKVRDNITALGNKHIKTSLVSELQNDWNEIDKKATGGTFETSTFAIDKEKSEALLNMICSFRTKISKIKNC
ncbi:MAG: hypothetical protein AB7U85_02595 [Alphaproteobacteria bacterium]